MARVLELDELVEHFTLLPDESALLRNKFGATRLGFALLLKFFVRAGRFPTGRSELGDEADTLTGPDRRGLSPLFWTHVLPYSNVRLDMARRLTLTG